MIYRLGDVAPQLRGEGHFVAPNASVIGDVVLHSNTSIWFNCVMRADNARIEIGSGSNVQDGSVLHVDPGFPLTIGRDVTIGHKVTLHGCTVGDGSLVGINAVVLNGARIGKGCIIGANALVTEGMIVPDGAMVLGSPAKVVRSLTTEQCQSLKLGAAHYVQKSALYNETLQVVENE